MTYPVIFIHYGDCFYLEDTLQQAKKNNQNKDVILIGDDSNNKYDFIQHINMDNDELLDNFMKVYRHMNSNPYQYEVICLARWFILRSFMMKYGVDHCYYQDSDVMLYKNINQEKNGNYEIAFCNVNGGSTFVNTLRALEDFCMFIIHYYTNEVKFRKLNNWHQQYLQSGDAGGVCDMTFIDFYRKEYSGKVYDLAQVHEESTYDFNINAPIAYGPQGYETWQGRKKIYRTGDGFFCKNKILNKFIKFNSLHFQGDAKCYIKYFAAKVPNDEKDVLVFDYSSLQWRRDEMCVSI
ncbi:MAG: hypothetical protein K0R78_337 [Pelosinus sp.]|jgi:hypothetical protein|nr:hypothetical protein [Pelosinus sp.]